MRAARRQHRATPRPPQAVFDAGMRKALAALYSTEPLSDEQRTTTLHALEQVPYRKGPQGELDLGDRPLER